MNAYEFQAAVNDGFIQIPTEYKNIIPKNVKVIILSEETSGNTEKKGVFTAMKLDTRGFVWNREEANER